MKAYLQLCKLRVAALLVAVAVVTYIVSSHGPLDVARLVLLALAGGLACIGSALLNHYFDQDIDRLMQRTKKRPLPSGRITNPKAVFWMGLAVVASALAISSLLGPVTTGYILAGAVVYVVVYTLWLKRRSPTSTIVGGLSGSFAALAGWAATGSQPEPAPFVLALVVFLWSPPHFWSFALANSADYQAAGVPMVPRRMAGGYVLGSAALLVLVSLSAFAVGAPFGWVYLGVTLMIGSAFLFLEGRLLVDSSSRAAWRGFKMSGVYLGSLLLALVFEGLRAAG
ncbi:MAG: heme o synthase [Dehalococcoidia bacterium]|nr:heme o synthase [Dehalococcoidia bacterium]